MFFPGTEFGENTGLSVLVDFKLPMIALSGLRIDTVTLTNEKYKPYKVWCRVVARDVLLGCRKRVGAQLHVAVGASISGHAHQPSSGRKTGCHTGQAWMI